MSPASAGRFSTTAPPGKPQTLCLEPSPTGGAGIADRRPQKENNDLRSFSDSPKLAGARGGEEPGVPAAGGLHLLGAGKRRLSSAGLMSERRRTAFQRTEGPRLPFTDGEIRKVETRMRAQTSLTAKPLARSWVTWVSEFHFRMVILLFPTK